MTRFGQEAVVEEVGRSVRPRVWGGDAAPPPTKAVDHKMILKRD